jgi:hypothetical protein
MSEIKPKSSTKSNAEKKIARRRPAPRALELPQPAPEPTQKGLTLNGAGLLSSVVKWFRARRVQSAQASKLRVSETIQLGDKRFVSVIHVDGQRFLIGGSSSSVALLTQLDSSESTFGETLRRARSPRKRTDMNRPRQAA